MRDEASVLFRVAGWSAFASSAVAVAAFAALAALYIGFFTDNQALIRFGPVNDMLVVVQYVLALPVVVALHRILQPESPRLSLLATLIGIAGIIGTVIFQALLLAGVMSFAEQVGFVIVAILVIGIWILITGLLGRRTGKLQISLLVIIVGALGIGYLFWAYRVGQQLLAAGRPASV